MSFYRFKVALLSAMICTSVGCSTSTMTTPQISSPSLVDSSSQLSEVNIDNSNFTIQSLSETKKTATRWLLVLSAVNKVGKYSGLSSQYLTGGKFATDVYGGDGKAMRNAIQIFKDSGWKTDKSTRAKMRDALPSYKNATDDATQIVNRIIALQWMFQALGVPQNDEQVLVRLGIQQQCKEFVDRLVSSVGGTPKSYFDASISKSLAAPGMLAYKTDNSHATIITKVTKDSKGNITSFTVVDSNFGTGFSNPKPNGDVPWSRLVRQHDVPASAYKVLDIF